MEMRKEEQSKQSGFFSLMKLGFVVMFVGALTFSACNNDDDPAPDPTTTGTTDGTTTGGTTGTTGTTTGGTTGTTGGTTGGTTTG